MNKRDISYTLDGDTFIGHYRLSEHGRTASVAVQFERQSLAARLDGLPEEVVARRLLGELVRAKVAEEARPQGLAA